MSEMPIPKWVGEAKDKMVEMHQDLDHSARFEVEKLKPIVAFSTFFAEFEIKEEDLILHLFPRAGEDDKWEEGKYIDLCRNCKSRVPMPTKHSELKPCERCGHTGLVYTPGRQEVGTDIVFPKNMGDIIKAAVDKRWMGGVAIELVEELGAYVVQFQRASNTVKVGTPERFLDPILEHIDSQLDIAGNVTE